MLLKRLTEAAGPPGGEDEIRSVIREEIEPLSLSVRTDVLGNLLAVRNGAGPNVLVAAHMDEVSFMIVHIEEDGLLKFRPMGGVDPRVLVAKPVRVGVNKQWGGIGAKAIHLQSVEDRRRPVTMDQLRIDVGASSRQQAEQTVKVGDAVVFATECELIGDGCVKAKSLDDRAGCAVMIEAARRTKGGNVTFAWTVQEEIGLRGAGAAAYAVNPQIAIVVESTICFDVADTASHAEGTKMRSGPALSVMDSHTLAHRGLLQQVVELAQAEKIPFQFRRATVGGNDAGAIHLAREGIPTVSISIPTRYIHAPTQVLALEDYENTIRLVAAVLDGIRDGRIHP